MVATVPGTTLDAQDDERDDGHDDQGERPAFAQSLYAQIKTTWPSCRRLTFTPGTLN